jgi:hypothetical protein
VPHQLKNDRVELLIQLPHEHYELARFDWTGKIVSVKYRGQYVTGTELADSTADTPCGRGFYNEFGLNEPIGYAEIAEGDWFHKIGIGLLQKTAGPYDFSKPYAIRPADFEIEATTDHLLVSCRATAHRGYTYLLTKTVVLQNDGFVIRYQLENTGEQTIRTKEYVHNFLTIAGDPVGNYYRLKFPFDLQPKQFREDINPEALVHFGAQDVYFRGQPTQPFFFSNLSGGSAVDAHWELENHHAKIGISETGDFKTQSVNLWGWGHVLSPELFIDIHVVPGQTQIWSRSYRVYDLD